MKTPSALVTISTRHQVHIERLKSSEVSKVAQFLRLMDEDVRKRLAGKDITDFTRRRLDKLLESIADGLQGISEDFRQMVIQDALDLADYEAGFEIRSLKQIADYDFDLPAPAQLRSAVLTNPLTMQDSRYGGLLLRGFIDDAMRPGLERVTAAIRAGYFQGQTTNQILQAVRGTRAAGFTDGIWQIVNRDAETIVRTALQHAATQAKIATYEANSDIVRGVTWNAALEASTCGVCGALDGQNFPMDKGPRPPLHPRCRCAVTASLDERFKFLDQGATRFSRTPDGDVEYVPAKQTFYGWLKEQPMDYVESVIGPSRAKLLLDGGLSAQSFADLQLGRRFAPLNLRQMREIDPVAFTRAGLD
jgi:SPP1 gp7 family putative phage head morphogenesis protein